MVPTADLTPEEIEELVTPLPEVPVTEPDVENSFNGKTILQIINSLQAAIDMAMNYDPIMARSLNFKHSCEKAVEIYEELYKDILRRAKQSRLTDFFEQKN